MNNLNLLEVGITYTYKELCILFEEAEKTSHSRDAQKKNWARYFRWTNPSKQKYFIEEIYSAPLQKVDGRKNNGKISNSKFSALDDLLIEYFEENTEETCTLPQLAVKIGILSEKYEACRKDKEKFSSTTHIPLDLMEEALSCIHRCVLTAIKSSLDRLQKSSNLIVASYTVLLTSEGKKNLSKSDSELVTGIENAVLKDMGISRVDAYKQIYFRSFQSKVHAKLSTHFGYEVNSHYTEYKVCIADSHYIPKSNEDLHKLSRKFVITIGIAMLRYICRHNLDTSLEEYNQTELIHEIIQLIESFFIFISPESWSNYWDESEFNNDHTAELFWSQFCLVKLFDNISKTSEKELQNIASSINYRDVALKELTLDEILEIERILPTINWTAIYEDESYNAKCGIAFEAYFATKDNYIYSRDQSYVEEYSLYVAQIYMQEIETTRLTFDEFKEQISM